VIGLVTEGPTACSGAAFEAHWRLGAGESARAAALSAADSDVGRVVLLEFAASDQEQVRANHERAFIGLLNLNFYTQDIGRSVATLADAGCETWTDPVAYEVGDGQGAPTEVIVEGPDGVLFNLVEPHGDPGSPVGEIRAFLDERGTTPTGFSEVVTTAHAVRSIEQALSFYVDVLGFEIWLDAVFDRVESNRLLALDDNARSRVTFVKGEHLFGKIALIEGLNYDPVDLVSRAVPPAVGYVAMSFDVHDLQATLARASDLGVETWSDPVELALPGLGMRRAALVRVPGSGALTQLVEKC
jgi:catechol 2,3-dioxygenase-like lactoylglutathione lyase family enzyme